jgi:dihydroorotate dehydrogenase (NAD+) catalytic subunit
VTGGLSGPAIKPIALAKVYEARKACSLPIIGIGGINSASDVMEFLIVGASLVQIGTANFINPNISNDILLELRNMLTKKGIANVQDVVATLEVSEQMKVLGW